MKVNTNYDTVYKAAVMTPEEAKARKVLPNKDVLLVGNLGGGSVEGAVLFNAPQSLTDAEKAQALANLGVEDGETMEF